MDIFYAFNDAYAAMAGISIFSLLKNNYDNDKIVFHIVDSGIGQNNKVKIENTILEYGQEVKFYKMPNFEQITEKKIDAKRWNINVFSKLFVGSILPDNVEKVICIDCDTVIVDSLHELWNTDLSNKVIGGVIECISTLYKTNLEKKSDDYYFNSGLVIFNVEELRKEKYEDLFWKCMQKYGSSLAYLDQDVINATIPQDKMYLLHPRYNAITPMFCLDYSDFMKIRRSETYYSEKEFKEAKNNPCIIHYTTFFMNELRPWFENSKHPKVEEFIKYKKMSLWRDEDLWKDNRAITKKIKAKIIKILPMFIMKRIASYLHGIVVPKKNKKKMINVIN